MQKETLNTEITTTLDTEAKEQIFCLIILDV